MLGCQDTLQSYLRNKEKLSQDNIKDLYLAWIDPSKPEAIELIEDAHLLESENGESVIQYKVKWVNFSTPTWEDENVLSQRQDLVASHLHMLQERRATTQRLEAISLEISQNQPGIYSQSFLNVDFYNSESTEELYQLEQIDNQEDNQEDNYQAKPNFVEDNNYDAITFFNESSDIFESDTNEPQEQTSSILPDIAYLFDGQNEIETSLNLEFESREYEITSIADILLSLARSV